MLKVICKLVCTCIFDKNKVFDDLCVGLSHRFNFEIWNKQMHPSDGSHFEKKYYQLLTVIYYSSIIDLA